MYHTPAFAAASYCGAAKADAFDLRGANMLLDNVPVDRFKGCLESLLGILSPVSETDTFRAALAAHDVKGTPGISGAQPAGEITAGCVRNADHAHAQHQAAQKDTREV